MNWIERLKSKWKLNSTGAVMLTLLIFALTGTTVLVIKRPLFHSLGEEVLDNTWFHVAYYILILPFYNVLLLFYGFLFGKFRFFWDFEKRFFQRLSGRKRKTI